MKKVKYCSAIVALLFVFTGCSSELPSISLSSTNVEPYVHSSGISNSSSTAVNSSVISSKTSISSSTHIVYSINDFKDSFTISKPKKIVTNVCYEDNNLGISLNYNSTLTIEYGDIINARYDYSYQKLNTISSASDEMITTYSGTYYAQGYSIGEDIGGQIKWNEKVESSISLFNIDFNENYFEEKSIVENFLTAKIKADNIDEFFKNNSLYISSVNLNAKLDYEKKITSLSLTYKSESNANVTISNSYSY